MERIKKNTNEKQPENLQLKNKINSKLNFLGQVSDTYYNEIMASELNNLSRENSELKFCLEKINKKFEKEIKELKSQNLIKTKEINTSKEVIKKNVALIELLGEEEARKQAEQFLEKFNMAGFAKRNPETLSGGEAQRVALARTLIVQPKLVLFDEPLSALDEDLRKKLAQEIRNMQRTIPFTAIMVTHDIKEALSISDDIIQIEKGKIVWCGKSGEFNKA